MQLRGLTLFLALCLAAGCTGAAGKIMADTKVPTAENPNALLVPYTPPDIEELTGVPEDEGDGEGGEGGEGGDPAAPPPPPAPPPAAAPAPAAEPKQ